MSEKRLIDVDVLKQKKTVLWDPALGFCDCVLVEDIDNTPTVDAVEVVHGRWIEEIEKNEAFESEMVKCSVCGQLRFFESNYCPNCGARMDGDC